MQKNFKQNRQTEVMVISIEIQRCLKRESDIGRKAVLSDVKTAFTFTPALMSKPIAVHVRYKYLYIFLRPLQNNNVK